MLGGINKGKEVIMLQISEGQVFGAYKVLKVATQRTSRGNKCYECECLICGDKRIFSGSYLFTLRSRAVECMCGKEASRLEVMNAFENIRKNYGKIPLCAYCTKMFKCVRFKLNAVNPKYMKEWHIERVREHGGRIRNLIIVTDCERFTFDYGRENPNFKHNDI